MEISMHTEGLMCGKCEAKAESAILALEGVNDVEADHVENIVSIDIDEDAVDPQDFVALAEDAIVDCGYKVVSTEILD